MAGARGTIRIRIMEIPRETEVGGTAAIITINPISSFNYMTPKGKELTPARN